MSNGWTRYGQQAGQWWQLVRESATLKRWWKWVAGGGVVAVVGLGLGFAYWQGQGGQPSVAVLSAQAVVSPTPEAKKEDKNIGQVWIDVSGAVVDPGVKVLDKGSRVAAALEKAGGMSEAADSLYVAQLLNLAQLLDDGDKLYIPTKAEVAASMPTPVPLLTKTNVVVPLITKARSGATGASPSPSPTSSGSSSDAVNSGATININTASESELDSLPGIGPATAAKIIAGRPYTSFEQLCQIINNSKTCAGVESLVSW